LLWKEFRKIWNPELFDSETFYKTDPNGFFVAEINPETVNLVRNIKCKKYLKRLTCTLEIFQKLKSKKFGVTTFELE
jgi:hypothetical protein